MKKIEQYIPNLLKCFKRQKFGLHESVCNGHTIYGKCRERAKPHHYWLQTQQQMY